MASSMSMSKSKQDSDSNSLASSISVLHESKQSNVDSYAGKMKRPSFLSRHLLSSSRNGDRSNNNSSSNNSKSHRASSNSLSSRQNYPVSAGMDPISMLYQKYPGMAASPR